MENKIYVTIQVYNKYLFMKFGMAIGLVAVYLQTEQLRGGTSLFQISLELAVIFSFS